MRLEEAEEFALSKRHVMYLAENFESDTDFFFDISQNWHRNKGCSGTINFFF